MLVKEAISLAKIRLKNLSASKNDDVLLTCLNLGMSDLYRRFNLSINSETILLSRDMAVYELRNDDVNMLLAVYDREGKELRQSDVLDSMDYDYKILNYRTFMMRHHKHNYVFAVYKANPIKLKDDNDEIELPDAMISPLITYIASQIEHTTNVWERGQVKMEASFHWQMYEKECQELINQGYLVPLNTETIAIQLKGFS